MATAYILRNPTAILIPLICFSAIVRCQVYNQRQDRLLFRSQTRFQCESEGFHPDPHDCSIFYRCMDWGEGSENSLQSRFTVFRFQCKEGTIYDMDNHSCIHTSESSRMECKNQRNGPLLINIPRVEALQNAADNRDYGVVEPQVNDTPASQPSYNNKPNIQHSPIEPANDSNNGIPEEQPPRVTRSPPCSAEGFFPIENDCSHFYRCVSNGKGFLKYEFSCGGGTVWDPDNNACNHAWAVQRNDCKSGAGTNGTPEENNNLDGNENNNPEQVSYNPSSSEAPNGNYNYPTGQQASSPANPSYSPGGFNNENQPYNGNQPYRPPNNSNSPPGGYPPSYNNSPGQQFSSPPNQGYGPGGANGYQPNRPSSGYPPSYPNSPSQQFSSAPYPSYSPGGSNGYQPSNNGYPSPNDYPNNAQFSSTTNTPYGEGNLNNGNQPNNQNPQSIGNPINQQPSSPSNPPNGPGNLNNGQPDSSPNNNNPSLSTNSSTSCPSEGFHPVKNNCKKFIRCVSNGFGGFTKYEFDCAVGTVWDNDSVTCNYPYAVQDPKCRSSTSSDSLESNQDLNQPIPSPTPGEGASSASIPQNSPVQQSGEQTTPHGDQQTTSSSNQQTTSSSQISSTSSSFNQQTSSSSSSSQQTTSSSSQVSGSTNQPGSTTGSSQQSTNNQQMSTTSSSQQSSSSSNQQSTSSGSNQQTTSGQQQGTTSFENQQTTGSGQQTTSSGQQGLSTGSNQQTTSNNNQQTTSTSSQQTSSENNSQTTASTNEQTTNSSQSTSTTSGNENTNSSSQTTTNSNKQDVCKAEGFFPSSTSCNKFYRCVNNGGSGYTKYEFNCGPGTVWDPDQNTCNHPWAVQNEKCRSSSDQIATPDSSNNASTEASSTPLTSSGSQFSTTPSISPSSTSPSSVPASSSRPSSTSLSYNGQSTSTISPSSESPPTPSSATFSETPSTPDTSFPSSTSKPGYETSSPSTTGQSVSSTTELSSSPENNLTTGGNTNADNVTPEGPNNEISTNSPTTTPGTTGSGNGTKPIAKVNCTKAGFYPHPTDCKKFYRCVDWDGDKGKRFSVYHFDCPAGTIFDPSLDTCNHEASVYPPRQCDGNTETMEPTTTTLPSNTSTNGTQPTESPTTPSNSTETTSPEENVSTTPNESSTGTTDASEQITSIPPNNVTTPSSSSSATDVTTDGSNGETTTSSGTSLSEAPTESTTGAATYPPPSITTSKPAEGSTLNPTTAEATTMPSTSPSESCPEVGPDQFALVCPTGFRRHPKYCNLFYQCTVSKTNEIKVLTLSCTNGTIYDDRKIQCLPPDQAKKCDGSMMDTRNLRKLSDDSVSPIPVKSSNKSICPGEGSFTFKDDCRLFYKCQKDNEGRLNGYVYQCPEGFGFWNVSKRCEKIEKVPCDGGQKTKPVIKPTLAPVETKDIGHK